MVSAIRERCMTDTNALTSHYRSQWGNHCVRAQWTKGPVKQLAEQLNIAVKLMKSIMLLACLLTFQSSVMAVEITVGETRFIIPSPEGYSEVTSDLHPYAELATRFVPPVNEQFVAFISDPDVAVAARGEIPTSDRRFCVQTSKKLIEAFVTKSKFLELKQTIKSQNAEMLKKVEAQMPGFLQKVSKGISEDYNIDLTVAVNRVIPLPPHYETERGLAYSMILAYQFNDENGKSSTNEGVVTATFVHLRGKVLFLYVYAEKDALEWCRTEARKWTDAIIAANPSVGEVAFRENRKPRSGLDWSQAFTTGLIGAVIGGIYGTIRYAFKRKKR